MGKAARVQRAVSNIRGQVLNVVLTDSPVACSMLAPFVLKSGLSIENNNDHVDRRYLPELLIMAMIVDSVLCAGLS